MMYPIMFRQERAAYFMDRLVNGQPIMHDPDQPGWAVDEILQLAGACFLAAAVHGPRRNGAPAQLQDWQQKHPEAEIETMMHDLHAVLEFMAELTQLAYDGGYDKEYEPVVRCGVQAVATYVQAALVRGKGFKGACGPE